MLSNDLVILFLGRVCGGLSTTLLYSAFETWMLTEYHDRELELAGLKLSNMFGSMTIISCTVAVVSGVVGEILVSWTGSRISPFLASVACLGAAFLYMLRVWVCDYQPM